MRPFLLFIGKLLLVFLLTAITQIGGAILLLTWLVIRILPPRRRTPKMAFILFLMLYTSTSTFVIPDLAEKYGRVPLPLSHPNLKPANIAFCLLNRHYVRSELRESIIEISSRLGEQFPESEVRYLDANFPFMNKFPLLPHLSHNDGKKLDLAFFYEDSDGKPTNSLPSVSGYGIYDKTKDNEYNTCQMCQQKGYWQYDYSQYFTFGSWGDYQVDTERTTFLIRQLAESKSVGKIFIEPHLKQRWGVNYSKIRFHGCQAVRHDDHIHLQLP